MTLAPATRLGPYEIVAPLGAGGMGEVYRAKDTRLGREVAIKVLPAEVASDPERLRRFEKEARAASALNHPNILTVHDFGEHAGTPFLVTELLEGESLRQRLRAGPVPARKAAEIGAQIARALAAAHAKGIVHRDLKPENLFLTKDGGAKILDFGLARQIVAPGALADGPTMTLGTEAGTLLGTVGYMAPEQVRGEPADHRADLFAFGCVFFEMLTGRRAFQGSSAVETMSAILRDEPELSASPTGEVSPSLQSIVRHCLEKPPEDRFQSARDLAFALESSSSDSTLAPLQAVTVSRAGSPRRRFPVLLGGVALALLVGATALFLWFARRNAADAPLTFELVSNFPGSHRQASFSPDGNFIAFITEDAGGTPQIWVKNLSGGDPIQITHGEPGAHRPRWSPKNDRIVYDVPGKGIWSVAPLGGAPRELLPQGFNANLSPDGERMVYEVRNRIWVAGVDGQEPRRIEAAEQAQPVKKAYPFIESTPAFSPDGKEIVYFQDTTEPTRGDLWSVTLAGGAVRRMTSDQALARDPVWLPSGRAFVFSSTRRGGLTLWQQAGDGGEPVAITTGSGEDSEADLSRDGRRLIFTNARNALRLMWLNPQTGERRQLIEKRAEVALTHPAFSPSGDRLAFFASLGADIHLFTIRPDGRDLKQVTREAGEANVVPDWSGDGRFLYYYQTRPQPSFRRIAAEGGVSTSLIDNWTFIGQGGVHVDPRGLRAVYTPRGGESAVRTRLRELANGRESDLAGALFWPRWSPDGNWLAGADAEGDLALCPANGGSCRKIAPQGNEPRWSADGQQVYFVRYTGYLGTRDPKPVPLFRVRIDGSGEEKVADLAGPHAMHFFYDVSPTGEIAWCEFVAGRQELWRTELPRGDD